MVQPRMQRSWKQCLQSRATVASSWLCTSMGVCGREEEEEEETEGENKRERGSVIVSENAGLQRSTDARAPALPLTQSPFNSLHPPTHLLAEVRVVLELVAAHAAVVDASIEVAGNAGGLRRQRGCCQLLVIRCKSLKPSAPDPSHTCLSSRRYTPRTSLPFPRSSPRRLLSFHSLPSLSPFGPPPPQRSPAPGLRSTRHTRSGPGLGPQAG